ncbi:hypothetical protein [Salinicoccus sp. HZC-1]|uniref:hypothetical protein n=1 Tax=Salinicoccus sp. HZC-1 TaxID=3385497 RepID=UPI00398B0D33
MDKAKRNITILSIILIIYLILANLGLDTAWWAQMIVILIGLSAIMQNYRVLKKAEIEKKKNEIRGNKSR